MGNSPDESLIYAHLEAHGEAKTLVRLLNMFFSDRVYPPQVLSELPSLVAPRYKYEAEQLKAKCEATIEILKRGELVEGLPVDMQKTILLEWMVEKYVRQHLEQSFKVLLAQLTVEALLAPFLSSAPVMQSEIKRVWGLDEASENTTAEVIAGIFKDSIRRRLQTKLKGRPPGSKNRNAGKPKPRKQTEATIYDITEIIKAILSGGTSKKRVSQEMVAERLKVTSKTVYRRLRAEKTTCKKLVAEIADRLGY